MISRRRLLSIAAASLCAGHPLGAGEAVWRGRALGAETSIKLRGDGQFAREVIHAVNAELRRIEELFSLYDPASALARLNAAGVLDDPPADFVALLQLCDRLHTATKGAFDPTVQPLWRAHATGGDIPAARALIGWDRVGISADRVTLDSGQALTLNGIAQGWASDRIAALLRAAGYGEILVDIGELVALGGPWHIGVAAQSGQVLDRVALRDRAIATSSPRAMLIGGAPHILSTDDSPNPLWHTVSVEADSAAMADGLSTACIYMDRQMAKAASHAMCADVIVRQF